jgi:hypothetical protein
VTQPRPLLLTSEATVQAKACRRLRLLRTGLLRVRRRSAARQFQPKCAERDSCVDLHAGVSLQALWLQLVLCRQLQPQCVQRALPA